MPKQVSLFRSMSNENGNDQPSQRSAIAKRLLKCSPRIRDWLRDAFLYKSSPEIRVRVRVTDKIGYAFLSMIRFLYDDGPLRWQTRIMSIVFRLNSHVKVK